MPQLPNEFLCLTLPHASLFCKRVFGRVQFLLVGTILALGKRTVSSILRIMGLGQEKAFHKYHQVLNQAHWSTRHTSLLLLNQLISVFIGDEPLGVGLDETLERRWGS